MRPSLVLLAGPNGAGKSTLYQARVAPSFAGIFINADLIQRDELQDASMEAAYRAAEIAAARRADPSSERDALIAATGIVHVMPVVTRNVTDFEPTGVKANNPWME